MFCFEDDFSLLADVCANVLARAQMSLKENVIVYFYSECEKKKIKGHKWCT